MGQGKTGQLTCHLLGIKMKKSLIILILVLLIIIIAILLSNLPFDIVSNNNASYEQIDVQMRKLWY